MREPLKSFYFPHDTSASHDPKLIMIRMAFGYKALGMYWNIIEAMHREEGGMIHKSILQAMILDFYSQEEIRTSQNLEDEHVELEKTLFDTGVLREDENGMIYSTRVMRNLAERKEKSEQARAAINARWNKEDGKSKPSLYGRNTPSKTDVIPVKKRKEKEIKVDNNVVFEKSLLRWIRQHGKTEKYAYWLLSEVGDIEIIREAWKKVMNGKKVNSPSDFVDLCKTISNS